MQKPIAESFISFPLFFPDPNKIFRAKSLLANVGNSEIKYHGLSTEIAVSLFRGTKVISGGVPH